MPGETGNPDAPLGDGDAAAIGSVCDGGVEFAVPAPAEPAADPPSAIAA
jgi:hypothetical protein